MWPNNQKDSIPLNELESRKVYRIESRNLLVGVWNPRTEGFIGIRQKFGSRYLFTEHEWTTSPTSGTAYALEDLKFYVPDDIELLEYFTLDKETNRRVHYVKEHQGVQNVYVYDDESDVVCLRDNVVNVTNEKLFNLLDPYDNKFLADIVAAQNELNR